MKGTAVLVQSLIRNGQTSNWLLENRLRNFQTEVFGIIVNIAKRIERYENIINKQWYLNYTRNCI